MNKSIFFTDIKPFVRYSRIEERALYRSYHRPYDDRLFYCREGSGTLKIDGNLYFIKKGTVIMWRRQMKYSYIPSKENPFSFDAVNFDFTYENSDKASPIIPIDIREKHHEIPAPVKILDVEKFNGVFLLENAIFLKESFERLRAEFVSQKIFRDSKCSAILLEILSELARAAVSEMSGERGTVVDEMLAYIHDNACSLTSNSQLSKKFGYHKNYINSLILSRCGMSLHRYVLVCRINKAIKMLHETNKSIDEIARTCGFSSAEYFSRYFKKITGITPSKAR